MKLDVKAIKPLLKKYGPSILTGLAGFGVFLTGYLVHRADMSNVEEIAEQIFKDDADIPLKETIKRVTKRHWKSYIPAGVSALVTVGCIVGSNQWHISKEGALAAAVTFYKSSGEELEKKIAEKFGDEALKETKADIARDRMEKDRPPWEPKDSTKMTIYEPYTKQWFRATQQEILWAELCANKMLQGNYTVTLNEILALYPGCKKKKIGETIGWSYDDETFCELSSYYGAGAWIDLIPQIVETKDGETYFQMEYGIHPNDITEVLK